MEKKILGWGECVAKHGDTVYDDIVENSASLSVEEGNEENATQKQKKECTLIHNGKNLHFTAVKLHDIFVLYK